MARSVLAVLVVLASCTQPQQEPEPPPATLPAPTDGGYLTDAAGADCIGCHAGIVQSYGERAKGVAGIDCAACHGDPTDHNVSMDPVDIDTPVALGLEDQEALCDRCHQNHGYALALRQSACFRGSEALTCLTCHVPHPTSGDRVLFDACSNCHAESADLHLWRDGETGAADHTWSR